MNRLFNRVRSLTRIVNFNAFQMPLAAQRLSRVANVPLLASTCTLLLLKNNSIGHFRWMKPEGGLARGEQEQLAHVKRLLTKEQKSGKVPLSPYQIELISDIVALRARDDYIEESEKFTKDKAKFVRAFSKYLSIENKSASQRLLLGESVEKLISINIDASCDLNEIIRKHLDSLLSELGIVQGHWQESIKKLGVERMSSDYNPLKKLDQHRRLHFYKGGQMLETAYSKFKNNMMDGLCEKSDVESIHRNFRVEVIEELIKLGGSKVEIEIVEDELINMTWLVYVLLFQDICIGGYSHKALKLSLNDTYVNSMMRVDEVLGEL